MEIVKTEPIDAVIPVDQGEVDTIAPSRSPQPPRLRRSGRIQVVLPTKRQLYGSNPPAFENASTFINSNNLLQAIVKKEEDRSAMYIRLVRNIASLLALYI